MLVTSADSPEIAAALAEFVSLRTGETFYPGGFSALGWLAPGPVLVGSIVYQHMRGRDLTASIALDGRRFPPGLLKAGLAYPFGQLSRCRLTFLIEPANLRSIKLVKGLGAVHEATLRDAGSVGDMHLYALFADDCPIWQRMKCRGKKLKGARGSELQGTHPASRSVEHQAVPDDAGGDATDANHALRHTVLAADAGSV